MISKNKILKKYTINSEVKMILCFTLCVSVTYEIIYIVSFHPRKM